MSKGIVRLVQRVIEQVEAQISARARSGSYASGLSPEGYDGGYRDALNDVLLALNGVTPNRNRYDWHAALKGRK